MQKITRIRNLSQAAPSQLEVKLCDSFWTRFKGLMFVPALAQNQGVLLGYTRESILDTSIHMFFMNFDIAVIWLDKTLTVVDKKIARKWQPYYASSKPAQYVLEIDMCLLDQFTPGDQLVIEQ